MQWLNRAAAIAVLWWVSMAAPAQGLPPIQEFYFDEDASTLLPIRVIEGSGDDLVRKLVRFAERDGRRADEAQAQLGGLLMDAGRTEEGKAMYRQVLARLDANNALRKPVLWHYGWALYRAGEPEAALAQWAELLAGRGVEPSWAPPTLALVLWTLDRRDEAVQWYAAAVRTWPGRWSGTAQYPQLLPDWREDERATLAEVQAAWSQQRPAWP